MEINTSKHRLELWYWSKLVRESQKWRCVSSSNSCLRRPKNRWQRSTFFYNPLQNRKYSHGNAPSKHLLEGVLPGSNTAFSKQCIISSIMHCQREHLSNINKSLQNSIQSFDLLSQADVNVMVPLFCLHYLLMYSRIKFKRLVVGKKNILDKKIPSLLIFLRKTFS